MCFFSGSMRVRQVSEEVVKAPKLLSTTESCVSTGRDLGVLWTIIALLRLKALSLQETIVLFLLKTN